MHINLHDISSRDNREATPMAFMRVDARDRIAAGGYTGDR